MNMEFTKIFVENKELISLITILLGALWAAYKYFDLKGREERRHDYKAYHELVSGFVEASALEKQMVILYELRNYPSYSDITKELLEHLLNRMENEQADNQLIKQAKSTLEYINKQ